MAGGGRVVNGEWLTFNESESTRASRECAAIASDLGIYPRVKKFRHISEIGLHHGGNRRLRLHRSFMPQWCSSTSCAPHYFERKFLILRSPSYPNTAATNRSQQPSSEASTSRTLLQDHGEATTEDAGHAQIASGLPNQNTVALTETSRTRGHQESSGRESQDRQETSTRQESRNQQGIITGREIRSLGNRRHPETSPGLEIQGHPETSANREGRETSTDQESRGSPEISTHYGNQGHQGISTDQGIQDHRKTLADQGSQDHRETLTERGSHDHQEILTRRESQDHPESRENGIHRTIIPKRTVPASILQIQTPTMHERITNPSNHFHIPQRRPSSSMDTRQCWPL